MRRRLEALECALLALAYITVFALDCVRRMIVAVGERERFERSRRAWRAHGSSPPC